MSAPSPGQFEADLNDFDPAVRRAALTQLATRLAAGEIVAPPVRPAVNLHSHTFFSYNGYGYSPSGFAWKARMAGLAMGGIVDFDVLDGVDEYLDAAEQLGLPGCAGMETRIYLPEFGTKEINSPGEPGIAYHMGVGFVQSESRDPAFLDGLKKAAQARNQDILERVNRHLAPVEVDYARDVLPLTPNGNPTERHLCTAYQNAAEMHIPDDATRTAYWAQALGVEADTIAPILNDGPALQGLIRAKLMKAGGPGYVQPEGDAFPRLDRVNAFVLAHGAIPTYAWLDGTRSGEQAIGELLDHYAAHGTAALNIIPDRNWNIKDPAEKRTKLDNLARIVDEAKSRHWPIVVGTEMNAYGQRFVDDFDAPELRPFADVFLRGAHIVHGHTLLQRACGLGYVSDWAQTVFASADAKNAFYAEVGARLAPSAWRNLTPWGRTAQPDEILAGLN